MILTFVRYYLPGDKSGGPVRTIANLVDHLGEEFRFRIVSLDRDVRDPAPYPGVEVDAWNRVGRSEVYYVSPGPRALSRLPRLIAETPHDVLYLNSFFDRSFSVSPVLARRLGRLPARPVVLAPRGEFTRGALEIKRRRKRLYLAAARSLGLYRHVTWQASSEHEAEDIRRVMGTSALCCVTASDLPAVTMGATPDATPTRPAGGPLQIVFLSRVTRMKNLEFALAVLARVTVPVHFHIYGAANDAPYWAKCQALMRGLPGHVEVTYHGVLDHASVAGTLAQHDLFLLPTLGENYGHAICEALAAGVPPLISDRTPWRDLDDKHVGYVRPLADVAGFVEVIERLARTSPQERAAQARRARTYARGLAESSGDLDRNRALFLERLGG